ncbi:MAG: murein biosynthesis integral membrane protein MurJ [Myxococcota bacterium]|nr:murein biosynthesis integral membrane protein MurJ [Myxococcota bacterium]
MLGSKQEYRRNTGGILSTSKKVGIAALIWMVSNLLSRIVGVVREAVIGRTLGGGVEADVYWASFILPDFLNYLLAGGALSIVFIPIFSGYISQGKEAEGWASFSYIANTLLILLCIFVPLLWIFFPLLAPLVAPGFTELQQAEVVRLTRIILPAQMFHLLGGLLAAAQQAKNKHHYSAAAGLVYALGIIVGGLILQSSEGFAYGVLGGSFFGPFLLNLYGAKTVGLRWSFALSFKHADVRKYIALSFPIMIGASIIVWDDFFLKRYGSLQGEGVVSSLQYAKTLMKVPMGVFGLAFGVAVYPSLAEMVASKNNQGAYELLIVTAKRVLFLALGAQVVLSSTGSELATIIYGSRLLDGQAQAIGQCLTFLSIGLWGWSIQNILARGFYARENTWIPTIIGSVMTVLTIGVYAYLGEIFGILGLAGASAIAVSLYVFILEFALRRFYNVTDKGLLGVLIKMGISVAICILVGEWLREMAWVQGLHMYIRAIFLGLITGTLYLAFINLWKIPEVTAAQSDILNKVRRKLRR